MSRLDALRRVAGLLGIATDHVDAFGIRHEADEETLSRLIAALGLPADPKQAAEALADEDAARRRSGSPRSQIVGPGRPRPVLSLPSTAGEARQRRMAHPARRRRRAARPRRRRRAAPAGRIAARLSPLAVAAGGAQAEIDLIVAPRSCHLPEGLRSGARSWGLTAQLYGLRSARDWGIGDFTDLEVLCRAGRRARRRCDRRQPAARAVRGRAASFQPVFAVEPRLAQRSLYRRDRGAGVRRGRGGAGARPAGGDRRGARRRAGRLRRGRCR